MPGTQDKKKYDKKYRFRNRERIRERNKNYNFKNKEKIRQYRIRNKKRINANRILYIKHYYKLNKDKINARVRQRYIIDPQKHVQKVLRNAQSSFKSFLKSKIRSIKPDRRKLGYNIDIQYLLEILELQQYKCAITGLSLTHKFGDLRSVSIDRINSKLGYIKGNIQLVCVGVNLMKRNYLDKDCRDFIKEIKEIKEANLTNIVIKSLAEAATEAA